MAELQRLSGSQLRLNEALPWDVYDVSGQLLLRKGYVVQRNEQIDILLERGMFVDSLEFDAHRATYESAAVRKVYDPHAVWQAIQAQLNSLLISLPGDGSFEHEVQNLARHVILLCERFPDLAIAAILLKEYKRYPIAHSVHCAVLCALISRRGDFDEASRISLCAAALTANAAMIEPQQLFLHQKTPITPQQLALIRAHPEEGVKLLMAAGVNDKEWLRAVLEHHELEDGSGYPRQVKTPSLSAMIIHTSDVFTALLSPRADRKPLVPSEAAKRVYLQLGHGKENPFPGLLVKELGMYPPGALVKLANGEVGVVCKRGEQTGTPIVATLINVKGLQQLDPVRRDTASSPQFKIVSLMPRESTMVPINFEQIWSRKS